MAFRIYYRLLLLAWPRQFRRDHADEAARVFADACAHDRRTRGLAGVLMRVGRATIEVPTRGLAERGRSLLRSRSRRGTLSYHLAELLSDARFSIRSLRRSPAYTVTTLLTMTIGIGLSTVMFTTFNAVGLRGWPVENADSLVLFS